MDRLKAFIISILIFITFTPIITCAAKVKAFVPEKPWQITINLSNFEPWDFPGAKTILGGSTKDDINITIIVEKTKPGTKPDKIRKVYGYQTALKFGKKETIEEIDAKNTAIIAYRWSKRNIPDLNEQQTQWAKDVIKDRWGYHGYVVKDDIAFDIHLSADMSKHTRKEVLDIIKSFHIKPSTELKDLKKFYEALDENITSEEKEKLIRDFIKKYPDNPEARFCLGEELERLEESKKAYQKALENHKIQPFIKPFTLLKCYAALGMCHAISDEYDLAKQHLESSYNLGRKIEEPHITALSAYILACVLAKTNDVEKSIKYLTEAVKIMPRYKREAKEDSSFKNIRKNPRFTDIVGK